MTEPPGVRHGIHCSLIVGNRRSPADEPSEKMSAGSGPQSRPFRLFAASRALFQSIVPKHFVFFSQISPVRLSVNVPSLLPIKRGSGIDHGNKKSSLYTVS